ncbi:IS3 family transposase [Actinoplanes couchii]
MRDDELTDTIERIHQDNYGVCGARKIWHKLHRRAYPCPAVPSSG